MSNGSKKARNISALSGGALVAASPFIATGTAAAGATFTVDSLLDDNGAGTTLREAIELADADPTTADIITFQAGLSGTITLDGAALYVDSPVTIQGPGASVITVDADGATVPVFYTRDETQEAAIAISGLTITGSGGASYGGGITSWGDDVTLSNVVITGNTGVPAGGVYFVGTYDGDHGTLVIISSDISGNTGTSYAGGIYLDGGGYPGGEGPAINSLEIYNSTISGNDGGAYGGALYVESSPLPGNVLISNSTISGNTAADGGGGIYVSGSALGITIVNSTITGNTAESGYGGGLYLGSVNNTATIRNSVIDGNTASDDGDDIFADDEGTPVTANYSLIGELVGTTITGGTGMATGDPMLGALADNGGIGKTHLPQAGSPLIDAGDPAFAAPPANDQRGLARVSNGRIDIGAVEVQAAVLPPTGGSNGLMAGLGAALLGLGGALHLTGRRKRSA